MDCCGASLLAMYGRWRHNTPPSFPRMRELCAGGLSGLSFVSGVPGHPPSRVTTAEHASAILAASIRPRLRICIRTPVIQEGAGKTGCALHPRSRVPIAQKKAHTSIQVQRKHSGLPCAMALRLTSCSPRRTALLPPSSPRSLLLENLTPAPRRQNHTTSPYVQGAYVLRAFSRPPHLTARS